MNTFRYKGHLFRTEVFNFGRSLGTMIIGRAPAGHHRLAEGEEWSYGVTGPITDGQSGIDQCLAWAERNGLLPAL